MVQFDTEEQALSETGAEQSESSRLVPVAESIRYRKRAQAAEKQVETLAEQLAEEKSHTKQMAEELSGIKVEQELTRKLAAAGSIDIETAVLIAKAKINDDNKGDIDGVIEQLKREKGHLFIGDSVSTAGKTSPVKDKTAGTRVGLERAAKRAAESGNRMDLQEYLKLRRKFV